MVQGVSFSNFSVGSQQTIQKRQGNPPQEFLDKLEQVGIPSNIVAQGKDAVEKYAKANDISLPHPPEQPSGSQRPEPPAGSKSQGAAHANEHSALLKESNDAVKSLMTENGIASTGSLKGDIAAIKAAIAFLDKDQAEVLKDKFKTAGMQLEEPDKKVPPKQNGADHLAAMNKHFLVNKKSA